MIQAVTRFCLGPHRASCESSGSSAAVAIIWYLKPVLGHVLYGVMSVIPLRLPARIGRTALVNASQPATALLYYYLYSDRGDGFALCSTSPLQGQYPCRSYNPLPFGVELGTRSLCSSSHYQKLTPQAGVASGPYRSLA